MKQNVSAPTALIAIVLCAVLAVVLFGRREPQGGRPEDVFVLPFAPEVDANEVAALRAAVLPLGASVVFPPLPGDRSAGARIALVAPSGPAAAGGLRPGDLVVSFNGAGIAHPYALASAVAQAEAEQSNEVVIERAGEKQTLTLPGIRKMPTKEELF